MKIGVLALGSHEESHGSALPPDTDARIAEYIAGEVAERTDSEFLGVMDSAYEFPEIDTGNHQSMEEVVEELKKRTENVKSEGFDGIVIVNAHGGNQDLEDFLGKVEEETGLEILMDSTICRIEGPHAGPGELSVGSVIGIIDESKLDEHEDLEKNPEIGFVGFEEARDKYEWAERHAQEIIEDGIEVDEELGKKLLEYAIESAVRSVRKIAQ